MWVTRVEYTVNTVAFCCCFLIPVCLTAKLISNFTLSRNYKGNDTTILNLQYFVNYWLWYVILEQIQRLEVTRNLQSGVYGIVLVRPAITAFTLWLFYFQGCMYINYCYLRLLAIKLFRRELAGFQDVDVFFIDPIVSTLMSPRNKLLIFLLRTWIVLFNLYDHQSVPNRIIKFIYTIPRGTTVMDHALDTVCYVDDFGLLQAQYDAFIGALWGTRQVDHTRQNKNGYTRRAVSDSRIVEPSYSTQPLRSTHSPVQSHRHNGRNQRSVSIDEAILTTPISDIINSDKEEIIEPDEIPLDIRSDDKNSVTTSTSYFPEAEHVRRGLQQSKTYAGPPSQINNDVGGNKNTDTGSLGRAFTWNEDRSHLLEPVEQRGRSPAVPRQDEYLLRPHSPLPTSRSVSRGRSPQPHRHLNELGSEVKHAVSGVFSNANSSSSGFRHSRSNLLQPPPNLPRSRQSLPDRSPGIVSPVVKQATVINFADGRVRHFLDSHSSIPPLLQAFRSSVSQTSSPTPQYRVNPSSLDKFFLKGSAGKVTGSSRSVAMDRSFSNPVSGTNTSNSKLYVEDNNNDLDSETPYPTDEYLK